jgi:hypothetical protein
LYRKSYQQSELALTTNRRYDGLKVDRLKSNYKNSYMKKVIALSLVLGLMFVAIVSVKADTCGVQDDGSYVACANGPIVPEPAGWVHYNPGEAGCPAWFSWGWKQGCAGPVGLK